MKIEPTEAEIEAEARGKIRDWLHDPKLKFHFSSIRNTGRILREGILSRGFVERFGLRGFNENYGANFDIEDISVADREGYAGLHGEDQDNWLKIIFSSRHCLNIGFLLSSSLELRESQRGNETFAKVRIRPQKIDGLFVSDLPVLFEKYLGEVPRDYSYSNAIEFLGNYFDIDLSFFDKYGFENSEIKKFDPEFSRQVEVYFKAKEQPGFDKEDLSKLFHDIEKKRHEVAIRFLEEKIGKKSKTSP